MPRCQRSVVGRPKVRLMPPPRTHRCTRLPHLSLHRHVAEVPNPALWLELGGRLVERVSRALIAYLDTQPLAFAQVQYAHASWINNYHTHVPAAGDWARHPQLRRRALERHPQN